MTDGYEIPDEAVREARAAMAEWECGCLCDDRLRAGLAAAAGTIIGAHEMVQDRRDYD